MQESWIQDPNRNPNLNSQMFETAQQSLITASENLQTRSEVSHLLHSMLTDLETQDSLYTHYTHQQQLTRLQQDLTKTQMELEERRAYQTHMIQQRRLVGDQFVSEMFALSQRIQELSSWKEAHEKKVEEYDLVKRELERTKESIRNLQRSNSLTTNANHHQHQSTAVNANFIQSAKTMDSKDAATEMEKPKLTTNLQTNSTNIATTNTANAPMEKDNHPNAEEIETSNNHSKTVPDETAPHTESTKSTIKAKKHKDKQKKKKRYPRASFTSLQDEELLEIFAFLDAVEVIQAAQVNKAFYAKVNQMFGNVSSVDAPEDSVVLLEEDDSNSESDSDDESRSDSDEDDESDSSSEEGTDEEGSELPSSNTKPAVTMTPIAPTIVALPPPKSNSNASFGSSSSSKTQNQARAAMISNNPLSTMFSKFQPKSQNGNATSAVATGNAMESNAIPLSQTPSVNSVTTATTATTPTTSAASATGLTSTMANSMTSKLSPSELSVIISMTEKISRLTAEKEDLSARLEGTEAVKEFLISKVRDTELALGQKSSESLAVTQQSASDQEVISFLDGRVRELESFSNKTKMEKDMALVQIESLQIQSTKKTKVIEDMLQFERQQLADQEKEWKMTKKVLVKEVKHCRAQIATLTAELDSTYDQKERLKQALLSLNGGSGSGSGSAGGGVLSMERSPRGARIVGDR